jgi:hypothetical protein
LVFLLNNDDAIIKYQALSESVLRECVSAAGSRLRQTERTCPASTAICSGHGPASTIGAEKRLNPFVRG